MTNIEYIFFLVERVDNAYDWDSAASYISEMLWEIDRYCGTNFSSKWIAADGTTFEGVISDAIETFQAKVLQEELRCFWHDVLVPHVVLENFKLEVVHAYAAAALADAYEPDEIRLVAYFEDGKTPEWPEGGKPEDFGTSDLILVELESGETLAGYEDIDDISDWEKLPE